MILAFTGYGKSGKDTAAMALSGFGRRAFADPLKRELQAFLLSAYGIDPMNCTAEQKEFIRPYLVLHGVKRREKNPLWWIEQLAESIRYVDPMDWHDYTTPGMHFKTKELPNVVITDCRYINEAQWIESKGGRVILILRPGVAAANDEEAESIREIIASGLVSQTIDNSGSIEELHEKVRKEVLR